LTRHITDEAATKLHASLEEAAALISENIKLLDNERVCVCGVDMKSLRDIATKTAASTPKAEAKMCFPESTMKNTAPQLFNLESQSTPEKPLNINLDVELYQMENY
jgi:hypothetical protein